MPVMRGAYNALTAYAKLDIVTHLGSSYICKMPTTGNPPTNTTYWALLAQAGDFAGTAGAVCGENLFHNWDFSNPVNQRGVSGTITTAGYFYDRWLLVSGSVTIGTGVITLAASTVIEQRIETHQLSGKEVTVAVKIAGVVYSGTGTFPASVGTSGITITGFGSVTLGYHADYMYVRLAADTTRILESVKLELGIVSTLDKQPPIDFEIELLKCQRLRFDSGANRIYFSGYCANTTTIVVAVTLPIEMRISSPTHSTSGLTIRTGASVTGTVNAVACAKNRAVVTITGTGYSSFATATGYFDTFVLSAEL